MIVFVVVFVQPLIFLGRTAVLHVEPTRSTPSVRSVIIQTYLLFGMWEWQRNLLGGSGGGILTLLIIMLQGVRGCVLVAVRVSAQML